MIERNDNMKNIDQIIPLTFYREKVLLPHNPQDKHKGTIIYTANCSSPRRTKGLFNILVG